MGKRKNISEKEIQEKFKNIANTINPKPRIVTNCARAFLVGGAICTLGQIFQEVLISYNIKEDNVKLLLPIIMIFLGALLTGVGIYDRIASYGGAGTVVPITGFSNAIVAPAIEFKKEGFIFGVAAKMFTIAGPVLVYGIGSSVIIGIIYYLINLIK